MSENERFSKKFYNGYISIMVIIFSQMSTYNHTTKRKRKLHHATRSNRQLLYSDTLWKQYDSPSIRCDERWRFTTC